MLKRFERISGLTLNNAKSEILQIGVPLTLNYSLFKLKWEKERIYALGTWFYKDVKKGIDESFRNRLEILQNIIKVWCQRNLSWYGRVTVLKTLCLSKITFAISSLETPDWFIKEVEKLFKIFLWNNKPPRIRHNIIFNDYEKVDFV